jgi:hypothetical protein
MVIEVLKYFFIKLLWWNDVKRHIAITRNRNLNSKYSSTNAGRQNNKIIKERLIKLLSAIATLLAYIILLLSRKYKDSIIDTLILSLVIIQTIILAITITSILRGGERHVHRLIFYPWGQPTYLSPMDMPPRSEHHIQRQTSRNAI